MMCKEVHVRPPKSAQRTFQSLECVLDLKKWYCNLFISYEDRTVFIERTSNLVEGVIFVGAPKNITKVRRMYPSDILFLANGSGHNPVVIGKNANLDKAIQSVLNATLYNQGQDCCGPNTILVDSELLEQFMIKLLAKIKLIEPFVGSSEDDCVVVGPNTDKSHTIAIAKTFVNNSEYHVHGGDINPITGLIKPTVF